MICKWVYFIIKNIRKFILIVKINKLYEVCVINNVEYNGNNKIGISILDIILKIYLIKVYVVI